MVSAAGGAGNDKLLDLSKENVLLIAEKLCAGHLYSPDGKNVYIGQAHRPANPQLIIAMQHLAKTLQPADTVRLAINNWATNEARKLDSSPAPGTSHSAVAAAAADALAMPPPPANPTKARLLQPLPPYLQDKDGLMEHLRGGCLEIMNNPAQIQTTDPRNRWPALLANFITDGMKDTLDDVEAAKGLGNVAYLAAGRVSLAMQPIVAVDHPAYQQLRRAIKEYDSSVVQNPNCNLETRQSALRTLQGAMGAVPEVMANSEQRKTRPLRGGIF